MVLVAAFLSAFLTIVDCFRQGRYAVFVLFWAMGYEVSNCGNPVKKGQTFIFREW